MRFGVLGPVAAWTTDGAPVRIPELKVRALLADLLAHRGRTVSVDRLIDHVWDAALPANPASALQLKVSRLRQALDAAEPGAGRLIVSRAPGYQLDVDAEAVDAGRFAALTSQARATGEPSSRAALLADALAVWRGPAFADFADAPFARAAITRLAEERLLAVEEHAEARLEFGEHGTLVGELGELVARHPLRQRLRAAQLRALYRAGRHDEALASYADLRDLLADELGLDPSSELDELQRAILRQDPELDAQPAVTPGNVPAALTELIGRADAVAQVLALLEANRLVTLTGPGGVGKTRLALEVARELTGTVHDGVWLVELAGLDRAAGSTGSPAGLPGTTAEVVDVVAAVLGIRDDPATGAPDEPAGRVERLAGALRATELVLVLDNCEHVIEPVAALAGLLLRAAPGLRILTTSQEPLALPGEALLPVPPLDLPADDQLGALAESSAVRLFIARAAFQLDAGNAAAVASICRRLDGIPLALELAATRVRALGVSELAARLDDRFRLLTSGHRGAPARQQTLRAMIGWSWELATPAEQTVLRRLAVDADGGTLTSAEAVCGGTDTLELLARLVDRSLVVMVEGPDGPRYRLLESVRAYGIERLHEAGEFEATRLRHLDYYAGLADRAEPQLYGSEQRLWLERLDRETANLRAALENASQLGAADRALGLVNALAWYWFLRGRLTEGRRSLGVALTVNGEASAGGAGSVSTRARATAWRAGLTLLSSDEANPAAALATAGFEDIADAGQRARARWFLAFAHRGFGDQAVTGMLVEQALADFRKLPDPWGEAAALSVRATLGRAQGDLTQAKLDAGASEALFRQLGDRWGQAKATNTLGELAEIAGDYPLASRLHRDGLRMAEELQLWGDASFRLSGLGRIALLTGDFAAAEGFHQRAVRLATGQFNQVAEEFAEIGLALGARRQGRLDVAEALLRRWVPWLRRVDGEPGLALVLAELGFIAEQRGDAEAALSLQLDGLAAARKVGDPRAVALALEGLAGARLAGGDPRHAARLLGTATAARESVGAPLPEAERSDVDRIAAGAAEALGADEFAAEFGKGTTQPPNNQHF